MRDLNSAFRNCMDYKMIEANQSYIQEKILNLFLYLSEEERHLLDISKIKDSSQIDKFLNGLTDYVYGMPTITNTEISKLFKKEKKLKLPDLAVQDSPNVYLGWIDQGSRKLFIVYNLNDKFVGMGCRLPDINAKHTNVCTLCNHIGPRNEVAFVSPVCKPKDAYRSLGFYICLDSMKCNERIESTDKLEKILKDVNNIK